MHRKLTSTSLVFAGAAFAAFTFSAPEAQSDVACFNYGFAVYEADGTIASMSTDGRWQRWAPGAQEPLSDIDTGAWLACLWGASSVGDTAPDGSYLVVLDSYSLSKITAESNLPLLPIEHAIEDWKLAHTRDGRILIATNGALEGGPFRRQLLVESAPGSGDFSLSHELDARCQDTFLTALAPVSDERVAAICPRGILVMDIASGDLVHSGVMGSLADDTFASISAWSEGEGTVLYVLSRDSGPSDSQTELLLSQVQIAVDGTTTVETVTEGIVGWREVTEVAAVDGNRVAVHGNDGLELWQRGGDGVWTREVVDSEFDGVRVEAMTGPTRLLVSGWDVTEYTLDSDGLWQTESFTPVGIRPRQPDRDGCNASGGQSPFALWLAALGLALALGWRRRPRAVRVAELC